jgi:uncharacterized repeat protein (TIGR04138 family)
MLDPSHPIAQLLQEDRRYKLDAYAFIFEGLHYAVTVLRMGEENPNQPSEQTAKPAGGRVEAHVSERHVTGRELCEALRRYALDQYGYMAKQVLNSWGIHNTGDFGEIVFNLVRIGQMRKTPNDNRIDFDDVYDFNVALKDGFKITPPEE